MKVSRNFVKYFLGLILAVLILNIIVLILGIWNGAYGILLLAVVLVLFFLIFRKHKAGFIRFLAWTLPILFILGVLYVNFMPFGFHKEYSLVINQDGSITSSSSGIMLQDLKGKIISNLSDVYTYGQVNVVVKPRAVLRNAVVNITIVNSNQSNVYLAKTDFNVSKNKWDYFWDFSKYIPDTFYGNAKYKKNSSCAYFNASNKETLAYVDSSDMFEGDSFVVYAQWRPENSTGVNQQIIGHYNWELWQNNNSVKFMIGRLENKTGSMPSVIYSINQITFFNRTHSAIAVYKVDSKAGAGYMELYVDGNFSGRKILSNQTIWADYNGNKDLTLGWSPHSYGNNSYYTGCIYKAGFDYTTLKYFKQDSFNSSNKLVQIPILGNGKPQEIKITIDQ